MFLDSFEPPGRDPEGDIDSVPSANPSPITITALSLIMMCPSRFIADEKMLRGGQSRAASGIVQPKPPNRRLGNNAPRIDLTDTARRGHRPKTPRRRAPRGSSGETGASPRQRRGGVPRPNRPATYAPAPKQDCRSPLWQGQRARRRSPAEALQPSPERADPRGATAAPARTTRRRLLDEWQRDP